MSYVIPVVLFATPIVTLFAVIIPWVVRRERAKVEAFLPTLARNGPMTLDDIVTATETSAVLRGYLLEALDDLVDAGRLVREPPPPGHPIERFYRDTRYAVAKPK